MPRCRRELRLWGHAGDLGPGLKGLVAGGSVLDGWEVITAVAEEFIAGETLHALAKRHDVSRQLIRIWVGKFEAGAFDEDVQAADLIQEYEAKTAALDLTPTMGRPADPGENRDPGIDQHRTRSLTQEPRLENGL